MCGIVGFNWDDKELVKRMADELSHRGPDDSGYYTDKGISLGHRRLSIIDLSKRGHQPMFNENKDIAVVFNGEIYNFQKLRMLLKSKHKFNSNSDTEVIVHGYEEFGEGIFSHLEGMFAIAIWDSKKKRLILARDRIGKKPLYYYFDKKKFIFSSEIKSILLEDIKRKINLQCLSDYLSLRFSSEDETMFQGIRKLLPGKYLILEKNDIKIKEFWKFPEFNEKNAPSIQTTDKLIEESVKKRLISDVPIGVFLSGGLDSSTIVAYMSRLTDKIRTFSIGFNEPNDELKYAKIIAEKFNTEHTEIISDKNIFDILPKTVWHFDEPTADPAALPTYILSREISKKVKVALSGEGGDESFGGYQTLNYISKLKLVNSLPGFLRKPISFSSKLSSNLFKYPRKQILQLFSEIAREKDIKEAYKKMFYFPFDEKDKRNFLLNKVDYSTVLDDYFKGDLRKGAFEFYFKESLPNYLLMKADKMSMAHALEIRTPFLDKDIVEYTAGIPSKYKQERYLFRKTVKKLLPKAIMNRKKQGFTLPMANWFEKKEFNEKLKPQFEDLEKRNLFNKQFYRKIVENPTGFRNDHRLWVLLNFELWCKIYLDKIDYKKIKL